MCKCKIYMPAYHIVWFTEVSHLLSTYVSTKNIVNACE